MQPNGSPQPQEPEGVQIQPSPTAIKIDVATDQQGNKFVLLQFFTVHGQQVYFFEPDKFESFGNQAVAVGRQAKSGLVLPPGLSGLN